MRRNEDDIVGRVLQDLAYKINSNKYSIDMATFLRVRRDSTNLDGNWEQPLLWYAALLMVRRDSTNLDVNWEQALLPYPSLAKGKEGPCQPRL